MRGKAALLCALVTALILAASLAQAALWDSPSGGGEGGEGGTAMSQVDFLDFLGGVREFLSYALWARIDAIHHGYYGDLYLEGELVPYYYIISWLDPHFIDAYYVGGLIIFEQGQEERAVEYARQGIEANPDAGDLYVSLGDLYLRQGRYELARETYRDALGKQFELLDEAYVMNGIASASRAMGDLEGALSAELELLDSYRMVLVRPDLAPEAREFFVQKVNQLADEVRALEEELAAQAGEGGGGSGRPGQFPVISVN
jgi:tetratricopeptide (TPR) repeat protein